LQESKNALRNGFQIKRNSYDPNGNVVTQTDAEGVVTAYEYCSKDLVTKQIVDAGVGTLNLTTSYDVYAMKRITKMVDPEENVTRKNGLYFLLQTFKKFYNICVFCKENI
jgi:YD repeat-containing protein